MIDSVIWKEKLTQDLRILKRRQKQHRWTSRSIVLFERELMLTFFSIRALIEAGKLTDKASSHEYVIVSYPSTNKKVDELSKYNLNRVFDLKSEVKKKITLKELSNQFIHAFVLFSEFSSGGNLSGVLLCSDWEKSRNLLKLPIFLAIKIVKDVIADDVNSLKLERRKITGELRKVKIS